MERRIIYLGIAVLIVGIYALLIAQSLSTIVNVDEWIYSRVIDLLENETYAIEVYADSNTTIIVNVITYGHCIDFKFMDKMNYEKFLIGEEYDSIIDIEHTANYMLTYWNSEANRTHVAFLSNVGQCLEKTVEVKIGISKTQPRNPTEEKAILTKVGFGMLAAAFWTVMYGMLKEHKS
ncbi:hypothetical protein KEJ27_07230 [Candidatus Bathyarchaeota archaeon]|nr:hypothetical protein [Candidatus Bathyarchaeota archaeon]MBS7612974.1 hypothetical protein [Candidatus Bathyarchaeota archaeon]MBS7617248.1 hypothetical protein [Candidatus Bathyarchaeota archaeon]